MSRMHISIIGLGLIGGSLGLALKAACGDKIFITAIDGQAASGTEAVACGAADVAEIDMTVGVAEADIIFLCTPVLQLGPIAAAIMPYVKPGAIISDVGSTKTFVADAIRAVLRADVDYVSGHPMAGREQSGIRAADKNLFHDKWYILLPEASTSEEAVKTIARLVSYTGARITTMGLAEHDQCAAAISHIPHVAAAALVNLLGVYGGCDDNLKLAGGGFRDTTRIASSNADMWADICVTNPAAINEGLKQLQGILTQVIAQIETDDRAALHEFFSAAKKRRDWLLDHACSGSV